MKRLLPLVLAIPVIAVVGVVFVSIGRWLSAPDPPGKVDAIVVLSGAPDRRVPLAVALTETGASDEIWIVRTTPGPVVDEEKAVRAYVADRSRGRRAPDLVFLRSSPSLLGQAQRVHEHERSDRLERVAVLALPWEAARVRIAFARELRGADVKVWGDGARYSATRWWRAGRATTIVEAFKTGGTLALLGPAPARRGERPPPALPLRAVAGAFVVAAAAGVVCRRLAHRLGLVATPRLWRAHATPTPMLGGLAILAGIGAGGLAAGGIRATGIGAVAATGVVVLGLVGFVDDVAGLGPLSRLMWAAAAGSGAWLLGLRVDLFQSASGGEIADGLLTLLWFVGITHALNVLDHIDGATAGVGAVSAGAMAAVASAGGQFVVAAAAASVAGACLGYLVHNFPPARLFMGDMGALALGFALAAIALGLQPRTPVPVSAFVPILALGVPIFDTTVVTISRIRAGRSPLMGGTDHVSHRLRARGISLRGVVGVLVGAQVLLGLVAFGVATAPAAVGWLLVAVTAVAGLAALAYFLRQPEWTPPTHEALSRDVRLALARALDAIAMFEEAASRSGLDGVDPAAMRAIRDGARRLDAIQARVGAGPAGSPGSEPGPD